MPGNLEEWKKELKKRGKAKEITAYKRLKSRVETESGLPWEDDDDEVQDLLRDMWKADGSWTDEEEKEYQEKLKLKTSAKRSKRNQPG